MSPPTPPDPPALTPSQGSAAAGRHTAKTTERPNQIDEHPVPPQLRAAAAWSWRLLVVAAGVTALVLIVSRLRLLFLAGFVALSLTAVLLPLRRLFERIGLRRGLATAVTLILALVGLILVVSLVAAALAGQLGQLGDAVRDGVDQFRDWLHTGPLKLPESEIQNYLDRASDTIASHRDSILAGAAGATTVAVEIVTGAFLSLFTTIFFLYDGERIWRWFVHLFPLKAQASMGEAGVLGWRTLTGYVRGTVVIALVDSTCIGIGIAIVGVPLALPLAVLVFFGAFIPIVGATVTGFVAVAVALATKGVAAAVIVLVIIIAVQQIEGHILQPLVMGKMVNVHPLAVVLAVTAGSVLGGVIGAVVAVPVVAVGNTVVGYYGRRARVEAARPADPGDPAGPDPAAGSGPLADQPGGVPAGHA